MSFHEVQYPTNLAFGMSGGPTRRTDIVHLASGREERNAVWQHSRRKYNAAWGVKKLNDVHTLIEFYEARLGKLYGFRLKDPFDFKSCPPQNTPANNDQSVGTGDGSTTTFQLTKTYSSGSQSYVRTIYKPVAHTIIVAVDGVTDATATVNTTTGIITFPSAPTSGAAITAGFEFDTPVRFDTDHLDVNLQTFKAGTISSVPLIEVVP